MTLKIQRKPILNFVKLLFSHGGRLFCHAMLKPKDIDGVTYKFGQLYSDMLSYSEFSISQSFYELPLTLGEGGTHSINKLLARLYRSQYACLTYAGSSGAMLSVLTAVLPRLCRGKDVIVIDSNSHQSTVGAVLLGRWSVTTLNRNYHPEHGTCAPISLADVKQVVESVGAHRISAFVMVNSSYDGFFPQRSESLEIYLYLKSKSIYVILDGAWTAISASFLRERAAILSDVSDCVVVSLHKKGVGAESAACIYTNDENIAREIDVANDLGYRTTSPSAVTTLVTEHRLIKLLNGEWDEHFTKVHRSADLFRSKVKDIHPDLYVVSPEMVNADYVDPMHILISASNLDIDARHWARRLQTHHGIVVEKATRTGVLLIWGSHDHIQSIDETICGLRDCLNEIININEEDINHD